MGTSAIVALILQVIDAVMAEINAIRSQSGQTDAQLSANLDKLLQANDALYAALKAALQVTPKAS